MQLAALHLVRAPQKRGTPTLWICFNARPSTRPPSRLFSARAAFAPPPTGHAARWQWKALASPSPCPRRFFTPAQPLSKRGRKRQIQQPPLEAASGDELTADPLFIAEQPVRRRRGKRVAQQPQADDIATDRLTAEQLSALEDGLGDEQRAVLELVVKRRESVFFTGPAGTGKSLLLKRIIQGFHHTYRANFHSHVAVTASTGLAAFNIGGSTLHRFAGIGLGTAPTDVLISDILKDRNGKRKRWKNVQVLIIDEVSMVDAGLFDKLDLIARRVRRDKRPFGGIQLVITGDFFQLPPVIRREDDGRPRFCFEAEAWKSAVPNAIALSRIYRQSDPVFAGMLNDIREGFLTPRTIAAFQNLNRPPRSTDRSLTEPAELFPLRRQADAANSRRMRAIKSPAHTYHAFHGGTIEDMDTRLKLLSDCMAPEVVELKESAQVMLIKNLGQSLVNGSLGRVVGFDNPFNFAQVHDRNLSAPGLQSSFSTQYPVVEFQLPNGKTRTELCVPQSWDVERWVPHPDSDTGWYVELLATRIQVPLIPAWALSIHKSQGQSLDLVKVDLERVFETGQAYVALSRARTMEGLQVLNFHPKKVISHPKVRAFYWNLSNA